MFLVVMAVGGARLAAVVPVLLLEEEVLLDVVVDLSSSVMIWLTRVAWPNPVA